MTVYASVQDIFNRPYPLALSKGVEGRA